MSCVRSRAGTALWDAFPGGWLHAATPGSTLGSAENARGRSAGQNRRKEVGEHLSTPASENRGVGRPWAA